MKTKNAKITPVNSRQANAPRRKGETIQKLSTTLKCSVANKLQKSAPDLVVISSRLAKLKQQLEHLPLPQAHQDAICSKILALVEEHLTVFVSEFADLYRNSNQIRSPRTGLEGYLGRAAKRQEAAINRCHNLLDEFETLIMGSARPLIERYRTESSDKIAHQRMCALRRLQSILPEKYAAANGRPIEQVKHVLADQLKHILLKHKLPIQQSGRITDSLACKISRVVRNALKFYSFDINESFKSTRRRITS